MQEILLYPKVRSAAFLGMFLVILWPKALSQKVIDPVSFSALVGFIYDLMYNSFIQAQKMMRQVLHIVGL